jgi:uncharacterized repeat protein (TIGR01451 family)
MGNDMARFTNQAQLRYGNAVTNSNIAVGEILEVLSATKTAVRATYGQNDNVTYIVSIVNSGTTPVIGLMLTDNLGAYPFGTGELVPLTYVAGTINYYVNGTLQTTPTVTAGPPMTVTGINVPAGGNATIIYEASVNQNAPLAVESEITNTATITGGGITPIRVTETIGAASAPNLNITKSVSPVPVTENGTLTYTFRIQNYGSVAATNTTGVVITDTFAPVLNNLTAALNGTAWTAATDYTYNETTGTFSSTAGAITVPAATYTQDSTTGAWVVTPGESTLVITGTV